MAVTFAAQRLAEAVVRRGSHITARNNQEISALSLLAQLLSSQRRPRLWGVAADWPEFQRLLRPTDETGFMSSNETIPSGTSYW